MATATPTKPCFTCGKLIGRVKCEGCSKIFCLKDFEGHQQELTKQLEEVEVTRDLFRQSLTEKITDSRKHPLIEQIDKWENESINKIRQTAEEIRQVLIKHTAELNTKLEDRLSKLTDQLRQSREAKDFFETELNQWKEELEQMKNELIKPSSVTIRQDPTALVTRINVEISDRLNHVDEARGVDSIPCEYCNKPIKWCDLENHTKACVARYHERIQEQSQSANRQVDTTVVRCRYCDRKYTVPYLKDHEKHCRQNPVNIEPNQQYLNLYRMPSSKTTLN